MHKVQTIKHDRLNNICCNSMWGLTIIARRWQTTSGSGHPAATIIHSLLLRGSTFTLVPWKITIIVLQTLPRVLFIGKTDSTSCLRLPYYTCACYSSSSCALLDRCMVEDLFSSWSGLLITPFLPPRLFPTQDPQHLRVQLHRIRWRDVFNQRHAPPSSSSSHPVMYTKQRFSAATHFGSPSISMHLPNYARISLH